MWHLIGTEPRVPLMGQREFTFPPRPGLLSRYPCLLDTLAPDSKQMEVMQGNTHQLKQASKRTATFWCNNYAFEVCFKEDRPSVYAKYRLE